MGLQRILVANAKGGCGKTTIATNVASHYAGQGKAVRLFDYDAQGSALAWLDQRSSEANSILGVNASKNADHRLTRAWKMRTPPDTDVVVIDTPAGIDFAELALLFQPNDSILIPVLPSPIDIHATAHFIKALLTTGRARQKMIRLAVIANRVRKNTKMYHSLERFLFGLDIPFVASLRDTQSYAKAIEEGVGVSELGSVQRKLDKEQWAPIFRWLDTPLEIEELAPVSEMFELRESEKSPA